MSAATEHNLARLAEDAYDRRGDYPSLLFEGRWHTSGELFERSCRLAAGLAEAGVAPGDRVAVSMANCPEVGITYHALWRAGAVVTPAMFLLPEADLRHVLEDSGAVAAITTPEFLPKVQAAAAGLPSLRFLACAGDSDDAPGGGPGVAPGAPGGGGPGGVRALAELERAAPGPIVPRSEDELAALLYTGGTTGRAKGVMLSHGSLHYTGATASAASHVAGVTRSLATLPLSHSYGILTTIAALHAPEPGVSVLLRWFGGELFLHMVAEHGLQQSAVVPSMLQLLLAEDMEGHDLSSLRYLTSGGAPLAPEVVEEWSRRAPGVTIRQGYGLTETAALISSSPADRVRAGAVGLPVPGTEIRIVGPDGDELPAGENGEIVVRSPAVMEGYWNAPEATAEALEDGWLHTGDVGHLDADGYLYVVDRLKDLIIRGGFNVYPRDVEDALLEHPAVEMAAVVGRPHPRHGEEVVAFVAPRRGSALEPDALIAWAREHIGGYRYPREVHLVEAIPLTPVGKTDRKALRTRLAQA